MTGIADFEPGGFQRKHGNYARGKRTDPAHMPMTLTVQTRAVLLRPRLAVVLKGEQDTGRCERKPSLWGGDVDSRPFALRCALRSTLQSLRTGARLPLSTTHGPPHVERQGRHRSPIRERRESHRQTTPPRCRGRTADDQ